MKTTRLECVPYFHVFRFKGSHKRWMRIWTGCVSIEDEPILQTTYAKKDASAFPQYEAEVIDLGPVEFAEPKPLPQPFVEPTVEELRGFSDAGWAVRKRHMDKRYAAVDGSTGHPFDTYEEAITYIRQQMKD